MILSSWLAAVLGRLKSSSIQMRRIGKSRGRRRNPSVSPKMVEMLEQRQMLTNPAITPIGPIDLTANREIFPYGQNIIPSGTVIASVTVTDPDASPGDYTKGNLAITAGNPDSNLNGVPAFSINANDQIVVNDTRDLYLYTGINPTIKLTLTATDNGGATGTYVVQINLLTPQNQRPVIPQYGYGAIDNIPDGSVNVLEVKENSFNGTVVGTVTAIDPDAGDQGSLTYAFDGPVPGFNVNTPAFAIDPFTGKITVKDQSFLDYEARRQNIGSVVGDLGEGGLPGYADVVFDMQVKVTDNRGPNSLSSRTDQDGNAGTTADIASSHVYIRLRDVGETPPNVTNSTKSLSVNENSPAGLSLGYFQLIAGTPNFVNGPPRTARAGLDPTEPQQTHSFAIVGGNPNNTFAIDYTTGEVTVANPIINYEALNVYNLQIAVTDQNSAAVALGAVNNVAPLTTIATLNITVNDINENTAVPSGQSFTIPENTINGTVVGTVVATDPDTQKPNGQGSLVYKIISGNTVKVSGADYPSPQPDPGVGIFTIDPSTGLITVNNQSGLPQNVALNFENQPSFSLTVQVIDRGDLSTSANATVVINLSNVNETPPSLTDSTFTIAENRPLNTLVGKISAAVGEIGNTITSYQITAGNTSGAFAIDNSGNITVANPALINFETNPQFVLTVKATDNGTPALFTTAKVTINVADLNEQIQMLDQSFSLNENTPNGTVIGQIVTNDPDNQVTKVQGTHFVITSGNTGGAFAVDDQGRISVANVTAVNFEVNPTFSLIVTVNDTGASAVPATFIAATMTISLINVNDAPIIGNQAFNIKEHSLAGTVVGKVVATDEDLPAQKLTYAITGGDPTNAFSIDPNTGNITVNDPHLIDYNTTPLFNLTVQVTDNGTPNLSSSATVQIALLSVSAPSISSAQVTFPENTANGTFIYAVAASGGVSPYTYSIISGNTNNAFTISQGTGIYAGMGVITVNDVTQLNYEAIKKFDLKVLVKDSQSTPLGDTAIITVNLSNVNEAPILSGIEGGALTWIENNVGQYPSNLVTPISGSILVTDTDGASQNMSGATVKITGNYINGEDVLSFTPIGNITGLWDATTGTLTLSGTDTQANYTAALRSVSYTDTSNAPNTAKRTVTYQVTDDGTDGTPLPSNTVTRDIIISPVNDPPSLANIEVTSLNWVENTPPIYTSNNVTPITGTITATDPDSTNLSGAIVQITGNYLSTEDQLVFANTAKITGVFDAATGKLTLSGTDTIANYIAALRSVSYTDTSNAPNLSQRTVTYQVIDDGALTSNQVSRTINLTPVNDPPTLSAIEQSALTWIENTPPNYVSNNVTPITATLVAGDPDSATLTGATVQITGNYLSTEDRLVFVDTANITGVFDTATGKLTLSGTDTLAAYTAALRSVSYTNLSNAPNTSNRTLSYQVMDGGPLVSNIVTRDVVISPVNDPPTLTSIEGTALTWTENTAPNFASNNVTPITSSLVAGDPDSTVLTGATVQITGNYQSTEDLLVFTNTAKISGSFDPVTGKLTLTGTDTLANYTAALRSVSYTDTSNTPNTSKRTIAYQVSDDGPLLSNVVSRDINIIAVNDPPTLASIESAALNWIENTSPNFNSNNVTPVTATLVTGDPDSTILSGATIQITGNYQSAEDVLSFTSNGTITGSYDSVTGKLTLTGNDTLANYTAVLRTVTYTDTSDVPKTLTRTLTFQVKDDGPLPSNSVTRDIIITPVNDPPKLTGIESTALEWVENTAPNYGSNNVTATTATLVASDPDSTVLTGATVQITGNYQNGEDQLLFTNTGTISGVFDAATGKLTLTGTDTLANYTAALRSVSYTDTSNAPNTLKRTLTYQVKDDGPLLSNTVSRDINITPVNDPPTLSAIESTSLTWNENTPPIYTSNNVTPVTATLVAADPDSTVLSGASVQITGNYQSGEDRLVFTNTANITGTFDIATGKLTLVGTDTLANYTAALRSVAYTDLSDAPNTAKRTLTYQVSDDGPLLSNTVTRDIVITPVNDPPILTGIEGTALNWIENTPPNYGSNNVTATTATLVAGDPDSTVLTGATVQITGNYQNGEDQLLFTNTGTISGVFDAATGKLTLTGTDTLANYTAALRSVSYTDTANAPNTLTRTLTYQVKDDGPLLSNTVTRDINITPVNDPPTLSAIEGTALSWGENTPPNYGSNNVTPITATLVAGDQDSAVLSGATVQITGNYQSTEDRLVFVNTANISGSFDTSTGKLTLTGNDTLANYIAALRSVAYTDLSDAPNTLKRTVTYQVIDDGALPSNTVSRDITIVPVNDPPTLSAIEGSALDWIENTPPAYASNNVTQVTATIVAADPDSAVLTGATVQITGNYRSAEDRLIFTNTAKITGVFDPSTGKLTLTGTDTVANYTAALRSVAYTDTFDAPNTSPRTLTYQVSDDGPLLSNTVSRVINIVPVNDPPVLVSLESTNLVYTENESDPITGTIVAIDPDSTRALSATIQLTTNYVNGEDTLVFVNTPNITGSFNPATGTLTLTGNDTLTNYRAAIRSVNYVNVSDNPSSATRTLAFQIVDDSGLPSAKVFRNITVVPVNDAPVLSASQNTLTYIESSGALAINPTINVYDVDSPTLVGATITMVNFLSDQDVLGFVNDGLTMGNISIASNSGGVLKLKSTGGTATQAQWQAALDAVTYTNTSLNPNPVTRGVNFVIDDGGPVFHLSNTLITNITVVPVNNAPTLGNASNVTYTENGDPLAINPIITVSDPDNTTFPSGVVTIQNFVSGEDQIAFVNDGSTMGDISIQSNSSGQLSLVSLSGTATAAQWRAAFAAVTYYNTSDNPSNATRVVTFTLYDGQDTSNVLTSTVTVVPVNDAPVLSGIETTPLQYFENTAPSFGTNNTTIISSLVIASDPDSILTGAIVQITGNYIAGQDFLVFKNTANITGSYDTTTGTLTLTGADTLANYTAALNSIGYFNRSDSPNTATRTVSFTVIDDGGPAGTPKLPSTPVTRDITVIAVNDPPVLIKADNTAAAYTENAPPIAVMPNLNVTDADSTQISGATIQITTNYNANGSQDTLTFVNTAKITGSWNPSTGILTLSGSDTLSNYRTALRTVGFSNIHDDVTAPPRTVTFKVYDDTNVISNAISRNINITTVPDGAILSGTESTAKVFKALDPFTPATPITDAIVVTDYDSLNQTSAVIQITGNYVRGQDQLVIDQSALVATGLSAAWDDLAGKLTLTGTATLSNYQAALRAAKYVNTSTTLPALNVTTRTVSFQTFDDTAPTPLASNIVTRDVSINPNNVAPTLASGSVIPLPYTEKDPATIIVPNLTITDIDSPNINGATIKITGNYQFPEDQLVFTNIGPIQGNWNSTTGTLTLTGLDSLADYQTALQSVRYVNTNNNPSPLKRTVSFLVTDGLATSNTTTRDITVTPVNDPPVIKTNVVPPLVYAANSGAVAIAPALTVTDPDSTTINSARVAITFNYQRGIDVLSFTNTNSISGSFDAATGVLTLTGADTLSNYRNALQSVKYTFNTTPIGGNKTISFSAFDGSDTSVTVPGVTTRDIVFSNPPIVNTNTPVLGYPTGNVAATIAPNLTVTDPDSTQLASAVVQITSGYVSGTDVLSFTNTANITGAFDASTGKLTLTGLTSVSNYREALRTVKYTYNGTPAGQPKTIGFSAYDGSATSNVANVTVIFSSAPPVLNANVDSFRYPTANTPVTIAPQLTVTDPDSNFLSSATVQITAGYVSGIDLLSFQNTGTIKGSFDSASGILTLTGTDTVSNYRSALRTVQYTFTGTPTGQTKTLSFVANDGVANSNLQRVNIYVSSAPATISTNQTGFLDGTPSPVTIAGALTVTDPGSDYILSAKVWIGSFQAGIDSLLFTDTAKIKGSFDSSTGILTLTGTDTVGAYREALRTVKYGYTGTLASKMISFQVNDGYSDSNIAFVLTKAVADPI